MNDFTSIRRKSSRRIDESDEEPVTEADDKVEELTNLLHESFVNSHLWVHRWLKAMKDVRGRGEERRKLILAIQLYSIKLF